MLSKMLLNFVAISLLVTMQLQIQNGFPLHATRRAARLISQKTAPLYASDDDSSNGATPAPPKAEATTQKPQMGGPIMFDKEDFARDDIVSWQKPTPPKAAAATTQKPQSGGPIMFDKEESSTRKPTPPKAKTRSEEELDRSRPTGYANFDREEEEERAKALMDMERDGVDPADFEVEDYRDMSSMDRFVRAVSGFFKEVLVDGEYDSRRRTQARGVVKSIAVLSFGIGCVFTLVWYAFPGKFISYRGDKDFSARYSQQPYVDPDELLRDSYRPGAAGSDALFDNAENLPAKEQFADRRFLPSPERTQAPSGRSEDF